MWYLMRKMKQVKPEVIYARRKARQAKLERAGFIPYGSSNDSGVFNPHASDSNIPLNPSTDLPYSAAPYQHWDTDGRAIGFAGDPRLLAPQPQHAPARMRMYRSGEEEVVGTTYPKDGIETAGRSLVRQESEDSVGWVNKHEGTSDTYQLPRIISPPQELAAPSRADESLSNAYETTAMTTHVSYSPPLGSPSSSASALPPNTTQTSLQTQYANYHPSIVTEQMTSPPLPNPFIDATPTQFNHPQVPFPGHASEATNTTFYTADANMQLQGAGSPPPYNYQTNTPR